MPSGSGTCSLAQFEESIDEIVKGYLPPDFREWIDQYPKGKYKILHDNLWGTCRLDPHEIALLDTRLIQRLRRIHQTGAVYLIYPSAQHTRFEHSIGVLVQTEKICDAIQRFDPGRETPEMRQNLRFAALLHDSGHGPFSHTSEQFFSKFTIFKELETTYNLKSGASEVISYCIIRSKHMRAFVDALNTKYGTQLDCDLIASFISGSVPLDDIYISEVIHGPFDADKLDYMHRDSIFSGFKMNVDLDRLYYSIEVLQHEGETRLAGKFSGIAPLTQIMFNKMQLFTSVYHHHKVRAADCMIWALFDESFGQGTLGGFPFAMPWDFLRLADDIIYNPEHAPTDSARKLATSIRDRRLWKRALSIARRTVPSEFHQDAKENSNLPLVRLQLHSGNHPEDIAWRRRVAEAIWTRAATNCESWEVWLDLPKMPDMSEAEHLWITTAGNPEPMLLQECIPVTDWVSMYGTHRWTAHVFCPTHCREAIGKAAAAVLKDEVGLEFLPQAFSGAAV